MAAASTELRPTLRIKQGATFRVSGTVRTGGTAYAWTGAEVARMQLRPDPDADPVVSLTSAPGGGITLGPEPGRFRVLIPASRTGTLPANSYGEFAMEIDFPPGDGENEPDVRRPLEGDYTVDREIVR